MLRRSVSAIVEVADRISGLCLVAIVVLNLAAVFMRYVLLDSISWSEEGIRYVAIWMTFAGAAAASWFDEHMDMNLFADRGSATFRRWHRAALHALTAVFGAALLWQGTVYCWLNGTQTAPTTGLEMIWIYGALAVGGALLLIVSVAKVQQSLTSREVPRSAAKGLL